MRAALLTELPSEHLALDAGFPDPRPAADAVVLAVEACGICGTDLEILRGRSYAPELPFVLGHEPVGRVVEVGAEADPAMLSALQHAWDTHFQRSKVQQDFAVDFVLQSRERGGEPGSRRPHAGGRSESGHGGLPQAVAPLRALCQTKSTDSKPS